MNRSYKEIFDTLFTNEEIFSLLSPFKTAYENKAFDQLEGGRNVENLSLKIGDQRKVSGCFRATKWNWKLRTEKILPSWFWHPIRERRTLILLFIHRFWTGLCDSSTPNTICPEELLRTNFHHLHP
jgi:hypothetical protein